MQAVSSKVFGAALGVLAMAGAAQAGDFAGIFGYGIELEASGAGATAVGTTLYALNNGGGGKLLPVGSSAALDTTNWLDSSETNPTFSLGTFDPGAGDELILKGFSTLTYRDAGGTPPTTILAVYGNYRVSPEGGPQSSWPPGIFQPLDEAAVDGQANDDRWAEESASVDLLDGLAPGTYVLGTYGYVSTSDQGEQYANNNGNNYGATFTVVPEPASLGLLGLAGLAMIRRRRA